MTVDLSRIRQTGNSTAGGRAGRVLTLGAVLYAVAVIALFITPPPEHRWPWLVGLGALTMLAAFALQRTLLRFPQPQALAPLPEIVVDDEPVYESLIQALADGVFVAQDERFVLVNPSLPQQLGYEVAEFVGLPFDRVIAPESLPLWRERYAKRIGAGTEPPRAYPVKLLDRNGRLLDFELLATRSVFKGRPAVLGLLRDITLRQREVAELEMHRSHLEQLVDARTDELRTLNDELTRVVEFTRLVADNIPGRVAYWDSGLRCRFVNRVYCEWFGRTPEQLLGLRPDEIFGRPALSDRHMQAALAGEPQVFEREEVGAAGASATIQLHYIPDRRQGTVHGFIALALDVSVARESEQALLRLNEMLVHARDDAQAAGRAKSAFLANMSHEIRTPLNAIIGLAHLVRRDTPPGPSAERLSRVAEAGRHLLELVNGILDLSKIESGKLVLEKVDFVLDDVLGRAFGMLTEAAKDKGLELVIDTAGVPMHLRGDPTRLSQALVNLLGNAIKFTQRGSVSLRAWVVDEIGDGSDGFLVRFEVRDTGPGMTQDVLSKLFNAFEQAESSTTREYGGTGLGLAITRQLALLMGGDAGAESEPGVGSTFWITLQLQAGTAPARASEDGLTGLHTLLVDDLAEAREAMGDMLERLGMRVSACASGAEALSVAQAAAQAGDPIEVAVVDWLMPEMDGVETVRRLVAQSFGAAPLCMMASISLDETLRERAREIGVTAFVQKPVSLSTLHDKLRELLVGRAMPVAFGPDLTSEAVLRESHRGTRVLLAEDNAVNQEVATTLLENAGLTVDVAADGQEAVALASSTDYALILMDMQMPQLDGLDAARLLRAQPRTSRVPIIAMTANAYVEDRKACEAAGMNDFVTKPVDPPVLYEVLARWLRHAPRVQAEPEVPRAPEALGDLQELDSARGMAFFANREVNYMRGLRQFVELYERGVTMRLGGAPTGFTQRKEALRGQMHSLGGACVAIGATQLAHDAIRIEMMILENAEPMRIDESLDGIDIDLSRLVRRLIERMPSAAPVTTGWDALETVRDMAHETA